MALMYLPLYLLLLGICSAFLWLPALGAGNRFAGSPAKLPTETGRAVWHVGAVHGPASGDRLGRVELKRPAAKLGVHRAGIFLGSGICCAADCRSLVRRTTLS